MVCGKKTDALDDVILASLAFLSGFFCVIWTGEQLVLMEVNHLTLREISYLISCYFCGQLFGGLMLGYLIDRLGTRFIFMVSSAFMVIGSWVFYAFSSLITLEICSLLLGLGTSCISSSISKHIMQRRASYFYYYMYFFIAMTSIGCLFGISGVQYANQFWGVIDSKIILFTGLSFLFVLTVIDYRGSTHQVTQGRWLNSMGCYYQMLKCTPLMLSNLSFSMSCCFSSVFLSIVAPEYMAVLFPNNSHVIGSIISLAFMGFGVLPNFINLVVPKRYDVFKTCFLVNLVCCVLFLYVGSFITANAISLWLFGVILCLIPGLNGYVSALISNNNMSFYQPNLYGKVNIFGSGVRRLGVVLVLSIFSNFAVEDTTIMLTKASFMQDNIFVFLVLLLSLSLSFLLLFPRMQQYSKIS